MSLGLDEVVVVNIAVAPTPVGLAGFGSLLFIVEEPESPTEGFPLAERIRKYTNLTSVQADWKVEGNEVVKAAKTFYAQKPTPLHFSVGLKGRAKPDALPTPKPAESYTTALAAIANVDNSFYGVAGATSMNDLESAVFELSDYCEAENKVFFNTSNDPKCLKANDATDIMSKLKAKTLSHTISSYSAQNGEYPNISVAARAFTVNFEGTNTTITLFLKRGPTITAQVLTKSEKSALEGKNGNAFMTIGGVNVYSESRMADSGWFDTVHGVDWLKNRIQTDVFNLLYQSTSKIPYTDTGVGMVVQKVEQGLRQGVRNGLIAPGYTTDGRYLSQGYKIYAIPVGEVSSADKGNRIYRGITFEAIGAGALHFVEINGSFSE